LFFFFFSSRRRHTRFDCDWSSDVCSSDLKGRTLTAWQTIQDDLQQMGATVRDEPVVKDRNWITSRKPEDLEKFASAIVDELERGDAGIRDTGRPSQPGAHP